MNLISATSRSLFHSFPSMIYFVLTTCSVVLISFVDALNKGRDAVLDVSVLTPFSLFTTLIIIVGSCALSSSAFSHGHIGFAYLAENRRGLELVVRIVLIVLFFNIAAWVGVALSYVLVVMLGNQIDLSTWNGFHSAGATVRGALVEWVVYGVLASLTAVITKSSAFSMIIWVADVFVVESLLPMMEQEWAQRLAGVLPTMASHTAMGDPAVISMWSAAQSWLAVLAWVLVLAFPAWLVVRRRSVA